MPIPSTDWSLPLSNASNISYFETADGLSLYYRDFGSDHAGTPIICLPGLTRNSRDFEELANSLSTRRRVITVDFRGRGFSDRDPNWRNYHPGTYVSDVMTLLDLLNIKRVIVIGTSLGGLCAMVMAATAPDRIAGVILNDIGPEINPAGLSRIQQYTGHLESVTDWDEAVTQTRETYGGSLPGLSDAEWRRMAWRAYRADEKGVPVLDSDPDIGTAVREIGAQTGDPWLAFDALASIPTVVLWGMTSDILTADIVEKMKIRNDNIEVVAIPNRGHVPLLDEPECISAIDQFLARVA